MLAQDHITRGAFLRTTHHTPLAPTMCCCFSDSRGKTSNKTVGAAFCGCPRSQQPCSLQRCLQLSACLVQEQVVDVQHRRPQHRRRGTGVVKRHQPGTRAVLVSVLWPDRQPVHRAALAACPCTQSVTTLSAALSPSLLPPAAAPPPSPPPPAPDSPPPPVVSTVPRTTPSDVVAAAIDIAGGVLPITWIPRLAPAAGSSGGAHSGFPAQPQLASQLSQD